MDGGAWQATVHGVTRSRTRLSDFTFTFHFHALEKEMATHSSVLAWRIPGTGEPCGLQFMRSLGVRHDWSDSAAAAAYLIEPSISGIFQINEKKNWRLQGICNKTVAWPKTYYHWSKLLFKKCKNCLNNKWNGWFKMKSLSSNMSIFCSLKLSEKVGFPMTAQLFWINHSVTCSFILSTSVKYQTLMFKISSTHSFCIYRDYNRAWKYEGG